MIFGVLKIFYQFVSSVEKICFCSTGSQKLPDLLVLDEVFGVRTATDDTEGNVLVSIDIQKNVNDCFGF